MSKSMSESMSGSIKKCILIVDDDEDIRRVVQISLEKFADWRTLLAASGLEGFQIAKTAAPDAILLDVAMPDIDGLTLFQQLQTDSLTNAIPVVFLTAKISPDDRQHFARLGVLGVIAKPFNPLTIWQQLSEILGWQKG
jgi:CheY-like chemotaxis protein